MKTGGTSVLREFERIYKRKYYSDPSADVDRTVHGLLCMTDKSDNLYPNIDYNMYDVIHGHFTIKKYCHLNRPIFTILRDPVERVISHYASAKHHAKKSLSVEFFVKANSNLQSKMSGGNLEKFFFVGIIERLEESMNILGKLIGHKLNTTHLNQARWKKLQFTKKQIEFVKKYNKKDLKLYDQALKLLDKNDFI